MDLLEYQAKKLFRQVGIPVLPSETIAEPRELKRLQIPYPVVLKSQVKVGGRGKAGGIKFVTNTIDAIAAARTIFNLSILGEYPEVILAEARYYAQQELFLGIVIDYQLQCPVIFGSISGGMNIDLLLENLQQVVIEEEFSPFLARRLAVQMGLSGDLLLEVSAIIEKMYELLITNDLELIEINPLAIDTTGKLMALDGKVTISDRALARHPELINLSQIKSNQSLEKINNHQSQLITNESSLSVSAIKSEIRWLNWQDIKGKIGILTNDEDLALLCWDLIRQNKEKPACAAVINSISSQQQLEQILEQLRSQAISVLLINFWSTEDKNKLLAQTILDYCQPSLSKTVATMGEERNLIPANGTRNYVRPSPSEQLAQKNPGLQTIKFVIRLAEKNIEAYQQDFNCDRIFWTNNLDQAVTQAISLSKTK